jgi:hypothetical protein
MVSGGSAFSIPIFKTMVNAPPIRRGTAIA